MSLVLSGCISIPIFLHPPANAQQEQLKELLDSSWLAVPKDGAKLVEGKSPVSAQFIRADDDHLELVIPQSKLVDGKLEQKVTRIKMIVSLAGDHTLMFWRLSSMLEHSEKRDELFAKSPHFREAYFLLYYTISDGSLEVYPALKSEQLKQLIENGDLTGQAPSSEDSHKDLIVTSSGKEVTTALSQLKKSDFLGEPKNGEHKSILKLIRKGTR
jgi:hypothetical protein